MYINILIPTNIGETPAEAQEMKTKYKFSYFIRLKELSVPREIFFFQNHHLQTITNYCVSFLCMYCIKSIRNRREGFYKTKKENEKANIKCLFSDFIKSFDSQQPVDVSPLISYREPRVRNSTTLPERIIIIIIIAYYVL